MYLKRKALSDAVEAEATGSLDEDERTVQAV